MQPTHLVSAYMGADGCTSPWVDGCGGRARCWCWGLDMQPTCVVLGVQGCWWAHVAMGRWLWWKGVSLVLGTQHAANTCRVGRTWELVGTCHHGLMAVVEGRILGGGDLSCSQHVLAYMGAGGRSVLCVDGCGGRAHGQSSWVVRTRCAANTCRVGCMWLLVGAHCRVSMLRSNLIPMQQGACYSSRWGASACRRAPKGAGRGFSMMLLDAGTVRRQWWWWALLNGGEGSWRFVGEGGWLLSLFVNSGGVCCGCHRRF